MLGWAWACIVLLVVAGVFSVMTDQELGDRIDLVNDRVDRVCDD